jgi:hypothetical protein
MNVHPRRAVAGPSGPGPRAPSFEALMRPDIEPTTTRTDALTGFSFIIEGFGDSRDSFVAEVLLDTGRALAATVRLSPEALGDFSTMLGEALRFTQSIGALCAWLARGRLREDGGFDGGPMLEVDALDGFDLVCRTSADGRTMLTEIAGYAFERTARAAD